MPLLDDFVELVDLIFEEFLLDRVQGVNGLIVFPQHGLELINVAVVLLFLESDVDNGLGNVIIHLFELFGLLNQDFEVIPEVDFVSVLVSFVQNLLL